MVHNDLHPYSITSHRDCKKTSKIIPTPVFLFSKIIDKLNRNKISS